MSTLTYGVADSATMLRRNLKHIRRYPSLSVQLAGLPIVFLLLFVFGSAIEVPGIDYREFLIAGIFAQTVVFGSTFTGAGIADDAPQRLKSDLVGDHMVITLLDETDAGAVAATIDRLADPRHVAVAGRDVTVRVRGATSLLPELLRTLDAGGVSVAAAEVARATLDDVFLALTGRSLRESAVAGDEGMSFDPRFPTESPTPILEEQAS